MLETASVALATYFATIGPLDVAAIFTALTATATATQRKNIALRGTLMATGILTIFAVLGKYVLSALGISLPALRTSGGILLLLIAIEMVFARTSGAVSTTDEEEKEAELNRGFAIFPLATPLIAGPGAMGATILLMADTEGIFVRQVIVIASMLVILLMTYIAMLAASQIHRILGVTGMRVVMRISGIVLAALAVQYMFDGIAQSGIFSR